MAEKEGTGEDETYYREVQGDSTYGGGSSSGEGFDRDKPDSAAEFIMATESGDRRRVPSLYQSYEDDEADEYGVGAVEGIEYEYAEDADNEELGADLPLSGRSGGSGVGSAGGAAAGTAFSLLRRRRGSASRETDP